MEETPEAEAQVCTSNRPEPEALFFKAKILGWVIYTR